jgi:hypothetical protein
MRGLLDRLSGDFPSTLESGTMGLKGLVTRVSSEVQTLLREAREAKASEIQALLEKVEKLKAELADSRADVSEKARQAAELLISGIPADSVALKVGYRGDHARSSLYRMLKRNRIDVTKLRNGKAPSSGQG